MKVPIELRSHEQAQLDEFVPRAADRLEDKGLDEEAQEVRDVDIIDNQSGTYSAEPTEWAAIIGALRTLRDEEGLRSWWLRKKLAQRLARRTEEIDPEETASEDDTPGVEADGTTPQATA